MGIRERIRTSVPGSTEFYEETLRKWRARGTRAQVKALVESGQPIDLDIGAGDVSRPGWVTLDISDGCDLYWDLRRGIPFPTGSVRTVYSSHLFEHVDELLNQVVSPLSTRGSSGHGLHPSELIQNSGG